MFGMHYLFEVFGWSYIAVSMYKDTNVKAL